VSPCARRLRLVRAPTSPASLDADDADLAALKAAWTEELRQERGARWLLRHRGLLDSQFEEWVDLGLL